MARVKTARTTRARHKKILKQAKDIMEQKVIDLEMQTKQL